MDYDFNSREPQSHFEYVAGAPIDSLLELKGHVFNAMDQLEGWCSKEKAAVLVDLVHLIQPEVVVEIGVFGGKSLVPMAFAIRANRHGKVYGIDPWLNSASVEGMDDANKKYWGSVNHDRILQELEQKIKQFKLGNQIELLRTTSADAPAISPIDILHIDGNHSEATSFFDVTKWVPLVRKGGLIILDDISWHIMGKPSTSKAVEWVDERCIKLAEFRGENDWGIWVKP